MRAIEERGSPAIVVKGYDEFGEDLSTCHILTMEAAIDLRDELSEVIRKIQVREHNAKFGTDLKV